MIGRTVLHYEIVEKLGEGGMGVVYKARDTRLDRFVALKILSPDKFARPEHRRRFVREAKMASALNHPNIITIYEIDSAEGADVIVMEYVRGKTLQHMIPPEGMSLSQALHCAVQIADAMAKAHDAGIIHRDLKPGNIMVTEDGLVKILDFGLAKWTAEASPEVTLTALTETGIVVGTVAYMSPEQAMGEPLDTRSDIFSFGVLLYEMLTGSRPFQGASVLAILRNIHGAEPDPLHFRRPDLPENIERGVKRALEKDRDRRFQSMVELSAWLKRAGSELGVGFSGFETTSSLVPARLSRALGGHLNKARYRWLAIGLLLVLALAGLTRIPAVRQRVWKLATETRVVQTTPRNAFEWYARGRALFDRRDKPVNVDRAIDAFKEAIRQNPDYSPGYAALAEAYISKNTYNPDPQWVRLAAESARKAVVLNDDLAAAHLAMGIVDLHEGKRDEASKEIRRTIELDPLSGAAYRYQADLYVSEEKTAEAEASYKKALQLAASDWSVHAEFGNFLYRRARYQEAAAAWEEARRVTPDNVVVLRNLAVAYHMLDRDDEAAAQLQRALEIEPSATVYNNMGTLRFFQGRYSEAASAFEKAIELSANNYKYWGNLADAYRWTPGKADKAREAYVHASQLLQDRLVKTPDDPELRGSLAVYFAKSGAQDGARREVAYLEKLRQTPGSHFKSALVYEILGDRDKALEALKAAIQAGYSEKEIRNEPELVSLRTDTRYHRLMAPASQRQ